MFISTGLNVFFSSYPSIKGAECSHCRGQGCRSCGQTGVAKKTPKKLAEEAEYERKKTPWTAEVSAMHYFPSWTPEIIANMSFEAYTMRLASIPRMDDVDDDNANKGITGSRDLFDFDRK